MTMKKMLLGALVLTAMFVKAADAYSFVNDPNGYSYIQINEDLDSFAFKSTFKSIGNSGKVGFFVYPDGLEGQELKDYIAKNPADNAQFKKGINDGLVDLGALKAGDRVGFYLHRNNGDLIRLWDFQEKHGTTYIAFDKNGGKGKDEWMDIGDVTAKAAEVGPGTAGAPLPGALAILLLGGLGAGGMKFGKRAKKQVA